MIGLYFTRRASGSMNEFFLSGRSFGWLLAGTGMVATTFSSDTPLAVAGLVARNGLAGNWFWWSLAMGGMVTVFVFARLWRRSEVMTDLQLIEMRYGGRPAAVLRGFRALYIVLIMGMIPMAWVVGAILKVLNQTIFYGINFAAFTPHGLLGDPGTSSFVAQTILFVMHLTGATNPAGVLDAILIAVLLGVTGIYAVLSGMWGLALTDFLQFWLKLTGCIALAVVAVRHVGGIDALQTKMVALYGPEQGREIFQFIPHFHMANPWLPLNIFLIMVLVQWWAGSYSDPAGGGYVVQRMASCRNEKQSLLATLWFQLAHYCLRPWPWIMVGFAALVMFPEVREWAIHPKPEFKQTGDMGYAMVMRVLGPTVPGLAGLLIATFMAAFMSTMSTFINLNASYFINDFYRRFVVRTHSEKHYAQAAQIASAVILVIAGVVAFWLKGVNITTLWNIAAAVAAGAGIVSMLRWFWWRINVWVEFATMITSLTIFSVLQVLLACQDALPFWTRGLLKIVRVDEYKMLIISGITTAVWIATMLLTRPEKTEVLVAFYRKVQPGGPGWGPIARLCPDVRHDGTLGLSLLAVVVSSAMIFLVLPGVGAIIFGHYAKALALLTGAGTCALALGWIMNRMGWSMMASSSGNAPGAAPPPARERT